MTPIDEGLGADRLVVALSLVERVRPAACIEHVLPLLAAFADAIGSDAAAFVHAMRVDGGPTVTRTLMAGKNSHPFVESVQLKEAQELWLECALDISEPSSSRGLTDADDVHESTTASGYRHQIFVPAPSIHGTSSVGALIMSASRATMLDRRDRHRLHVVAQAMAMELHAWVVRSSAAQLVATAGIRPDDLELLRHEAAGLSSKAISQLTETAAQTIDCRFQRLNARMGVATRQAAAQLARLHGLI